VWTAREIGERSVPAIELIQFYYPLPARERREIEDILERADVLRTSFADRPDKIYRTDTYRGEEARHGTTTYILLDRNILTRLVGLIEGRTATEEHRLAAAVLAFAQCANILIEPSLPMHEVASSESNDAANAELRSFRVADEASPLLYADVALGRRSHLPADALPALVIAEAARDFALPLWRWKTNYIFALKLAQLELAELDPEGRMAALLEWMGHEFIIGAAAVAFAHHYLAPGGRRRRMLKKLRSRDRKAAIAGVKNAAWDLNLVSEWTSRIGRQSEERRLWLLCSRDRVVRDMAAMLLAADEPEKSTEELTALLFQQFWGEQAGKRLFERYIDSWHRAHSATREMHAKSVHARKDELIHALEESILGSA
jgi:hypothetical protein